jgi:hypothetical protein
MPCSKPVINRRKENVSPTLGKALLVFSTERGCRLRWQIRTGCKIFDDLFCVCIPFVSLKINQTK